MGVSSRMLTSTQLLRARGSLNQRQSAAATRLLWVLLHRSVIDYHTARLAVGRGVFDSVVVPVIILGESLASLARAFGVQQAVVSNQLRVAMDTLAEHFAALTTP